MEDVLTPASLKLARETVAEELAREELKKIDKKRGRILELLVKRKNGTTVWVEVTTSFIRDENDVPSGILCVTRDISERKKSDEKLAYIAYHDSLTGLFNRKCFLERLNESLDYAKRYRICRAILFIDLDRFKRVNDTLGHEAGDTVLKEVAERLKKCLRKTDYISRFGGDEFTVILNNPTDTCPEKVAENIVAKISAPYIVCGSKIDYITSSIGISVFPEDGHDVKTLVKSADMAMYKAKEKRKLWVRFNKKIFNE